MANDDLIQWITSGKKKGVSSADLKKSLKDAGYTENKIAAAFEKAGVKNVPVKAGGGSSKLPVILVGIVIIALVVVFALNGLPGTPDTGDDDGGGIDFELWQSHMDTGIESFEQDLFEEASIEFRKATEVNPFQSEGFGYLGWALLKQDRNLEAQEAFLKVKELDDTTAYGYLGLAVAYHKQGELDKAKGQAEIASTIATESQLDFVRSFDADFDELLE